MISLITLFLNGCTTTSKNVETPLKVENEVSSKKIFGEKENWQPINKKDAITNSELTFKNLFFIVCITNN